MHSLDYSDIRFCIYARKSQNREDKQIQSLESQKKELKTYAKKMGINVVRVYEDSASAHKPYNRPQFDQMLQDINNREIQGILTWKADRIARNMIEAGVIIHNLQTELFTMIKTPFSQYLSSDNMLMLIIEMGMANQYSLDLSKNVKRGNRTKIENGGFCNVAPIGYKNDKETRTIIKDSERFEKVQKLIKLYATEKYSIKELEEKCTNELDLRGTMKNKPIRKNSIYRVLKNPFYYGRVKNGENISWGNHEAMISEKEFLKVQSILARSDRKAQTSQDFAYTGLLKCGECGSGITAAKKVKYKCPQCNTKQTARHPKKCKCGYQITQKDIDNGKFYTYYMCTKAKGKCSQKFLNGDVLDQQFSKFINDLIVNDDFIEWSESFLKYLERNWEPLFNNAEEETQNQLERLRKQLNELVDLKLQKQISLALFQQKNKELEDRIKAIEKNQKGKTQQIQEVIEELSFLKNLNSKFKNAEIKHKKSVIRKLVLNPILYERNLSTQAKERYLAILDMRKHKNLGIEPPKSQSTKELNALQKDCLNRWWNIVNYFGTSEQS